MKALERGNVRQSGSYEVTLYEPCLVGGETPRPLGSLSSGPRIPLGKPRESSQPPEIIAVFALGDFSLCS
jgi:hypothetical protein